MRYMTAETLGLSVVKHAQVLPDNNFNDFGDDEYDGENDDVDEDDDGDDALDGSMLDRNKSSRENPVGVFAAASDLGVTGDGIPAVFEAAKNLLISYLVSGLKSAQKHTAKHLLEFGKHTSELQSLMRITYAVFCLKKQ